MTVTAADRRINVEVDTEYMNEIAELDGCYALKTDLPAEVADKRLVHARYKDLSMVERAFRTMKTSHLEVRPIFVRTEASTRRSCPGGDAGLLGGTGRIPPGGPVYLTASPLRATRLVGPLVLEQAQLRQDQPGDQLDHQGMVLLANALQAGVDLAVEGVPVLGSYRVGQLDAETVLF